MPDKLDTSFGFDPTAFIKGINQVTSSLGSLENETKGAAAGMSRGFDSMHKDTQGLAKAMGGMGESIKKGIGGAMTWSVVKAQALIGLAKGLVKTIATQMPEVTRAFSIAKDTFLKNFFWPLRQATAPLLQNLLNWTRDNRAEFAKWGTVVVNVFKAGYEVFKSLWGALKGFWDIMKPILGIKSGGFTDGINLLLTKIAVVAGYIGNIFGAGSKLIESWFRPNSNGDTLLKVAEALGKILTTIAVAAANAIGGFIDGLASSDLKNVATPLREIVDAIDQMLTALGLDRQNDVKGFFEWLGKLAGGTAQRGLELIAASFKTIADALTIIRGIGDITGGLATGNKALTGKGMAAISGADVGTSAAINRAFGLQGIADWSKSWNNQALDWITAHTGINMNWAKSPETVKDVIITKTGRVIKTDPGDTITARQGAGSTEISGRLGLDVTLVVTEGSARQAGINFGEGLQSGLRSRLLSALVREGSY